MKVGVGRIWVKTNTFAKSAVDWESIRSSTCGTAIGTSPRALGSDRFLDSFRHASRSRDIELQTVCDMIASPGGYLAAPAYMHLVDKAAKAFANALPELDAVLLLQSGNMVSEDCIDADHGIATAVRKVVGTIPLAVVLDSEANVSPAFSQIADVLVSTDEHYGISADERAEAMAQTLEDLAKERVSFTTAIEQLPMLLPRSAIFPVERVTQQMRDTVSGHRGEGGIVDISVFTGFPGADTPDTGVTISATSISPDAAREAATNCAQTFWNPRRSFHGDASNAEEAVPQAMASKAGPVILAELGDDPSAGAPGDGTTLLWALIDLGVQDAVLATIYDPVALDACERAAAGSTVEIPVGGRLDTRQGYPIDVRGQVQQVHHVELTGRHPCGDGQMGDVVRIAVVKIEARHSGSIELLLSDRSIEVADPKLLADVGMDLESRQIIAVKSSYRYRDGFAGIAAGMHAVMTPGITTPDPAFFEFQRIRRPMFPIDDV